MKGPKTMLIGVVRLNAFFSIALKVKFKQVWSNYLFFVKVVIAVDVRV